ncbi:MAG: GNAT family N-acetyltransferase [Proteobacteria bacterium]|nr:GNAT family N-acetyltransferase [Pseudomonadota bacterium]
MQKLTPDQKTDPKNNLEILVFAPSYQDRVTNLILFIQQKEFNIPITAKDQPDLGDIPGFYQQGTGNFWMAVSAGKVVGTISLKDIGNCQAALRKMFVHPDFRGKRFGTASALWQVALDWAGTKGISKIFLGTTDKFLAAHRFYEKKGFLPIEKKTLPRQFPLMSVDTKFYAYPVIKNKGV